MVSRSAAVRMYYDRHRSNFCVWGYWMNAVRTGSSSAAFATVPDLAEAILELERKQLENTKEPQ